MKVEIQRRALPVDPRGMTGCALCEGDRQDVSRECRRLLAGVYAVRFAAGQSPGHAQDQHGRVRYEGMASHGGKLLQIGLFVDPGDAPV